jgi:hypothetical protein
MWEIINTCTNILVRKPHWKRQLQIHRDSGGIKIHFREGGYEGVDWFQLAKFGV